MSIPAATTAPTRLLRPRDVAARIGLSKVTIYRLERAGQFPKSIQLSRGAIAWRETDIEQWIDQREADRSHL